MDMTHDTLTDTRIRQRRGSRALWAAALAGMLLGGAAGLAGAAAPQGHQVKPGEELAKRVIAARVLNCDRPGGRAERVLRALVRLAPAGAVIRVRGTCRQPLVIDRDDLTLRGVKGATFDGGGAGQVPGEFAPMIHVDGARRVVVEGVRIIGSSGEGMLVSNGAEATLRHVEVSGSANVGVLVDYARLVVDGGTFTGNVGGLDAINNASVILRGAITAQDNLVFGVAASGGSALELRGAALDASSNGLVGVLVEAGTLQILNFGVSVPSQVLANSNGLCGLVLTAGGVVDLLAPPPAQFTGVHLLQAEQNGNCGMLVNSGSTFESPFGAATIALSANPAGMVVVGNSNVAINGGLQVSGNFGPGLVADGAGVVAIGPADGAPALLASSISGNGLDVQLAFGSRAQFAGTSVGSIVCDGTALARGDATCP